jgi:sphingomyelin phosphodiesterase acid-like 3
MHFLRRFLVIGLFTIGSIAASAIAEPITLVSDIHFNPFSDCANPKNCVLITKLNQADAAAWPQILAQYSANTLPANGQPTNYALFHSTLLQIQQQNSHDVLILGDFLGHRYRTQYLKYTHDRNRAHYNRFVINTMKYMTHAVQQVLPADGAVYPVIGNNDSYGGKDCAYTDYCVIVDGSFYKTLADQWASLFNNEANKTRFTESFPHAGYYEVVLPGTQNHILVLNTVLFSTKVQGPNVDRAAQEELEWLQRKLQSIANAGEKTWLIFHIPPGIDAYSTAKNFFGIPVPFWEKRYSQSFSAIIHQYNSVIAGVFSGHTHTNGLLALDIKNPLHLVNDHFISSISPIFGNNPSYSIYTYDTNHFSPDNPTQYLLDLHTNRLAPGQWQETH